MTLIKLTKADLDAFKRVVPQTKRGRTGRFAHLAHILADMNVGEAYDVTSELSEKESKIVADFIASEGNLDSKTRAPIASVVSAFQRELRVAVKSDEAGVVGNYGMRGDLPSYIVIRTK